MRNDPSSHDAVVFNVYCKTRSILDCKIATVSHYKNEGWSAETYESKCITNMVEIIKMLKYKILMPFSMYIFLPIFRLYAKFHCA